MAPWLSAIVSLAGLAIGAGLAVFAAMEKNEALMNMASTIIGGALGMFVPTARGHLAPQQQPRRPSKIITVDKGT